MAVTPAVGLILGTSGARGSWISVRCQARMNRTRNRRSGATPNTRAVMPSFALSSCGVAGTSPLTTTAARSHISALGAWVEGRYRIAPRWYVAARVDRLGFSTLDAPASGVRLPWDAPVRRIEVATGYSIQRNVVLRVGLQLNERDGNRKERRTFFATQAAWWF